MNKNWAGVVRELLWGTGYTDEMTWAALSDLFEEAGDADGARKSREGTVICYTLPESEEAGSDVVVGGFSEETYVDGNSVKFRTEMEKFWYEKGLNGGAMGVTSFANKETALLDLQESVRSYQEFSDLDDGEEWEDDYWEEDDEVLSE